MTVAWFAAFRHEAALDDACPAWLDPVLGATPAFPRFPVHTPASTQDSYVDDGRPPAPVLQLYFEDVARLDAAQRHLRILATPDTLPSLAHHTAILARFPCFREIKVDTRIDWCDALAWLHVNHRPCNKVVFDDPPGLTAALNSAAPHGMRADYVRFRQFPGPVTHVAMHTAAIELSRCAGAVAPRERRG